MIHSTRTRCAHSVRGYRWHHKQARNGATKTMGTRGKKLMARDTENNTEEPNNIAPTRYQRRADTMRKAEWSRIGHKDMSKKEAKVKNGMEQA